MSFNFLERMVRFKIMILLAGIACSFLPGNLLYAQRLRADEAGPKGQFMLYGSLDYSKTNGPNNQSSQFSTSPGAGIPLGLGYFINNNDLIGINYSFSHVRDATNTLTMKQDEAGFWYSPSVMIGQYCLLIAQFDVHYVWGQQAMPTGVAQSFKGYRLRAYPMLGVLLGKGWALKFKFGELSMLSIAPKGGERTNYYVAGLSGATFGTGISKTFSFQRK